MNLIQITPKSFCDALEALHPSQHDAHIRAYNSFIRAYGSMEGYYLAMANKARSRMQLMLTEKGRHFIWRQNNIHSEYRRGRG